MQLRYWETIIIAICCGTIQCCPEEFFKATSDTCLHIANPSASSMQEYCRGRKSKLYGRPLSDKMSKNLAKEMVRIAEGVMPILAYLGMQNKAENDMQRSDSKDWHFEGEREEFKDDTYQLWYQMPQMGENCATTGLVTQFKALPSKCTDQFACVCEKSDESCYDKDVPYINYHGLCLVVVTDRKTYDLAKKACQNGHLVHLRTEDNTESIWQAFYNTRFAGGVYVGLNKSSENEWSYNNGDKEDRNWADDDKNEFDCGGVRILNDKSLGLYSIPCDSHRLHFLCEVKVNGY